MHSEWGRRRLLRTAAGVAGVAGLAGCSVLDSASGLRFRIEGGDWRDLTPIETDATHAAFYHGGQANETTDATHPYTRADVATVLLHRSTAEGADDGLVVTYDRDGSPDGGRARLAFDEPITPAEDLLVADGPLGRPEVETGDVYARDHFVHEWGPCCTDGAVVSTAPFSNPTFEFGPTRNLESVRVLTSGAESDPESTLVGLEQSVEFEFP